MINNSGGRSFSLESFKRRGDRARLSVIFTPNSKRTASPQVPYLPVTYASPHHYYKNQAKDSSLALQCRSPQQLLPLPLQRRQSCLLTYFAKLAKDGQQGRKEERPKPKSILVIRKLNKQREEAAEMAREKMEEQFRSRKQVPIHHSQLHFHRRSRAKAQTSSLSPHQRTMDFANKIHRAVQEILKLRHPLHVPQPQTSSSATPQKEASERVMEGRFSAYRPKPRDPLKSRQAVRRPKESLEEVQVEIGPWVRTGGDWQFGV